jgi:hypothetical protein
MMSTRCAICCAAYRALQAINDLDPVDDLMADHYPWAFGGLIHNAVIGGG